MKDNKMYKPHAIDLILGKGIIHEDSNLQDVAIMYFTRYRIVIEAPWFSNVGAYSPSIRTIAYTPNDIINVFGRNKGSEMLANNLTNLAGVLRNFDSSNYYEVLSVAIRIGRLYLLREVIYSDNKLIYNSIHDEIQYETATKLIDSCDNLDITRGIHHHITDEINYNYITGSILWELTEYIKTKGYEAT